MVAGALWLKHNGSLSNNHFSRRKLIVLNTIHESHKMLKIWLSTDVNGK
jgi:hypothetical protein